MCCGVGVANLMPRGSSYPSSVCTACSRNFGGTLQYSEPAASSSIGSSRRTFNRFDSNLSNGHAGLLSTSSAAAYPAELLSDKADMLAVSSPNAISSTCRQAERAQRPTAISPHVRICTAAGAFDATGWMQADWQSDRAMVTCRALSEDACAWHLDAPDMIAALRQHESACCAVRMRSSWNTGTGTSTPGPSV